MHNDELAIEKGYYFDATAANRAVHFVETFCRQSKGKFAGKPLTLMPWQRDFLTRLFGWKRPDKTRRYRFASIWVAKKNGKTTLIAAIALYMLVADNEPGAEVYVVANDQQQAGICYGESANMVEQSPQLRKKLKVLRTTSKIRYEKTRSLYRALSTEKAGKHGYNSHCVIFDELAFQESRELWDVLRYSVAFREQPLIISISTAGYDREGIGYEQYSYAKNVADGVIEDLHFLPVIYEADRTGAIDDPEQWHRANPSIGQTIPLHDLQEAAAEAKHDPRKEANFRTLRMNQWVGTMDQWISSFYWDSNGDPFDLTILEGKKCWVGLDLARKHDLAAYVMLFVIDGLYYLLPRFFIPKDNASQKERSDHVPYMLWADQGYLTLTDGDVIDYNYIRESLKRDAEKYRIEQIGYDPYNAELLCNQQLSMEDGFSVIEIKQTMPHLAPATAQFERHLKDRKIRHNNNPVLRWQAGNVIVRQDQNLNIMVDKKNSKARIDGIAASVMALSRYLANEGPPELIVF